MSAAKSRRRGRRFSAGGGRYASTLTEFVADSSLLEYSLGEINERISVSVHGAYPDPLVGFHWTARPVELSRRRTPVNLNVTIYLADEAIHEAVEAVVEDWLSAAGLTVEEWGEPVVGSWFRPLKAAAKQAVDSGIAKDAALTAIHAADTRMVLYQDAQTTALLLQNLGPVITSLQPTKDAVIRAGALLIVKVNWQVQVFQLTAAQQVKLDHRPQLASSPHEIVQALQLTRSASEGEVLPTAE